MAKYKKHEFRIPSEFEKTWEQFIVDIRRRGFTLSEGVRKAIETYLREKIEIKISPLKGKFLMQLPLAEFKMGNESKCIICGRESHVIIQTPYGSYGLCEGAWKSIIDLEEEDV
ncbi:MAG: hypothetical protein K6T73_10140 [Candidatus Bathyarchaeota archaeon]|nr:hypothetical protein [Candidatus Bathyarchaeota archaeon]